MPQTQTNQAQTPNPETRFTQTLEEVIGNIMERIKKEVAELYTTFREVRRQERISGKIVLKTNEKPTQYCYVSELVHRDYPIETGIRVHCEISLEVYSDEIVDASNVKGAKESIKAYLLQLLRFI